MSPGQRAAMPCGWEGNRGSQTSATGCRPRQADEHPATPLAGYDSTLGVVVGGVRRLNEVNARRARLVLGWVTVFGRVYRLGM